MPSEKKESSLKGGLVYTGKTRSRGLSMSRNYTASSPAKKLKLPPISQPTPAQQAPKLNKRVTFNTNPPKVRFYVPSPKNPSQTTPVKRVINPYGARLHSAFYALENKVETKPLPVGRRRSSGTNRDGF